jgi:C-terminal processing protease CtpA/Prc
MRRTWLAVLLATLGCSSGGAAPAPKQAAPPQVVKPAKTEYHDPDHVRGPLPDAPARHLELAKLRQALVTMYAHRLDKERRYKIDENAWLANAERTLDAAKTWAEYDAAVYKVLGEFHDDHLAYHPPRTAAPARGYARFKLGLTTVLAGDHLLVSQVDEGSDVAKAGVVPGDEVTAIDGLDTPRVLARSLERSVWSRPESAKVSFARQWSAVLMPLGDPPRVRKVRIVGRSNGAVHDITITPREAPKVKRDIITTRDDHGIAIVTLLSMDGKAERAKAIDDGLVPARAARGIVLDLRGVRGGVDLVGYRVVAGLAEGKPSLGSFRILVSDDTIARRPRWKHLAGTAGADGFSPLQPLTVDGQPAGKGFHGPMVVLVDAGCASTCEVVAAALRTNLHAILIGETTAGSTGAPIEVALPIGSVSIPTWDLITSDGHSIESDGVVPDVIVIPTPASLAAGEDLALRTAIDRVRATLPP